LDQILKDFGAEINLGESIIKIESAREGSSNIFISTHSNLPESLLNDKDDDVME
jgi:hypothetical protein